MKAYIAHLPETDRWIAWSDAGYIGQSEFKSAILTACYAAGYDDIEEVQL